MNTLELLEKIYKLLRSLDEVARLGSRLDTIDRIKIITLLEELDNVRT